ncbi:MAG: hypothetical protein ACKOAU_20900 [Pirellula sp.]|jgi:hypothetical protein
MSNNPLQNEDLPIAQQCAHSYRPAPPLTPEQQKKNWAAWYQAMELTHAMLLAGLRNRIGSDGDIEAAFREWSEHHRTSKWVKR